MNIVILHDHGYVTGGAAAVAISSAIALASRGHRVIYLTAVEPIDERLREAGIEVLIASGPSHKVVKDANLISERTWNFRSARLLEACLFKLNPKHTIVHLHGWTKALSSSVARVAVNAKFRVVCTLHDYSIACPRGGFFNHKTGKHCGHKALSAACLACQCDSGTYYNKLSRVTTYLTQITVGKMPSGIHAFITVSNFSHRILSPYLPSYAAVFNISNPIDVPEGHRVDVSKNRAIVVLGRVTEDKGCILASRATGRLHTPIIFVGDGPGHAQVLSVNPEAVITGWLTRTGVREFLGQARVLVFPSLLYETQGLAVPEAAAMGVPAIVSDSCAAAESIVHESSGLLFRNGDLSSLEEALGRLSDDGVVESLGNNAYNAYWINPATLDRHAEQLEQAYQNVLYPGRF